MDMEDAQSFEEEDDHDEEEMEDHDGIACRSSAMDIASG